MAWYRCGGGGVPASVKTDMNAVLNKKFGTSSDYPPADWAPTVNLMGPLPEKTQASASICSFDDGADDVPTKSLVVTVSPTLSGKSEVVVTQINSDNLFLLPSNDFSVSGVDFKIGSDSLTIDGTSTANISSKDSNFKTYFSFGLPKGTYYFTRGTWTKATYVYKLADDSTALVTNSGSFTLTDYTEIYIGFYIGTGQTVSEVTFNGYLKQGSSASSYSPQPHPTQYTASLGRTIYGGTADIVNGVGQSTHGKITDFSTLRANGTSSTGAYRYIIDVSGMGDYNVGACVSNLLTYRVSYNANVGEFYNTTNVLIIFLAQDNAQDAITYLQSNSCEIAYPLATPTDFTFTGQEIPTRLGYNAFWSDEGDTEVTYRADIDLLLGGN